MLRFESKSINNLESRDNASSHLLAVLREEHNAVLMEVQVITLSNLAADEPEVVDYIRCVDSWTRTAREFESNKRKFA